MQSFMFIIEHATKVEESIALLSRGLNTIHRHEKHQTSQDIQLLIEGTTFIHHYTSIYVHCML